MGEGRQQKLSLAFGDGQETAVGVLTSGRRKAAVVIHPTRADQRPLSNISASAEGSTGRRYKFIFILRCAASEMSTAEQKCANHPRPQTNKLGGEGGRVKPRTQWQTFKRESKTRRRHPTFGLDVRVLETTLAAASNYRRDVASRTGFHRTVGRGMLTLASHTHTHTDLSSSLATETTH